MQPGFGNWGRPALRQCRETLRRSSCCRIDARPMPTPPDGTQVVSLPAVTLPRPASRVQENRRLGVLACCHETVRRQSVLAGSMGSRRGPITSGPPCPTKECRLDYRNPHRRPRPGRALSPHARGRGLAAARRLDTVSPGLTLRRLPAGRVNSPGGWPRTRTGRGWRPRPCPGPAARAARRRRGRPGPPRPASAASR